jgi:hypothetical protein
MMFKDYALFDIRIRGIDREHSTVEVHSELGGDANGAFVSPTNVSAYPQYIARLQRLDTDEDMLVDLGQLLFLSIFSSRIKEVYTRSQGKLAPDQGLRLRFDIDPALSSIAAMPWEFLYDPDQGPLVMLDAPIVRYLSQQSPPPVLKTPLPLKVLLTGAVTPPEPNVKLELEAAHDALAQLEKNGHIQIEVEEHLTRAKFQRLLRSGFHIWHFVGHGSLSRDGTSGSLLFEDSTGSAEAVSARELGILLNRSGLQLIVLDACSSAELTTDAYRSVAPALVHAQIPAVIAMQFTMPQDATRAFAGELYRALAEGFPIDACVNEGRKAVVGATGLLNPDWGIPVVYTRAPDGKLFDLPTRTSKITLPLSDEPQRDHLAINVTEVDTTISGTTSARPANSSLDYEHAEELETLRELIHINRRRLLYRHRQAARYGITADPVITMEIADIKREIGKLTRELRLLDG